MSTPANIVHKDRILGGLWGSLVGDALGVPVEFRDRYTVQSDPVTDMREFGTHHTLHASLWCLLTTQSFRECVLKAVNLGGDTDTIGCVAGGLAGVAYGTKSIPTDWTSQLARKGNVDCLFHKFADLCSGRVEKNE